MNDPLDVLGGALRAEFQLWNEQVVAWLALVPEQAIDWRELALAESLALETWRQGADLAALGVSLTSGFGPFLPAAPLAEPSEALAAPSRAQAAAQGIARHQQVDPQLPGSPATAPPADRPAPQPVPDPAGQRRIRLHSQAGAGAPLPAAFAAPDHEAEPPASPAVAARNAMPAPENQARPPFQPAPSVPGAPGPDAVGTADPQRRSAPAGAAVTSEVPPPMSGSPAPRQVPPASAAQAPEPHPWLVDQAPPGDQAPGRQPQPGLAGIKGLAELARLIQSSGSAPALLHAEPAPAALVDQPAAPESPASQGPGLPWLEASARAQPAFDRGGAAAELSASAAHGAGFERLWSVAAEPPGSEDGGGSWQPATADQRPQPVSQAPQPAGRTPPIAPAGSGPAAPPAFVDPPIDQASAPAPAFEPEIVSAQALDSPALDLDDIFAALTRALEREYRRLYGG